MRRRTSLWIDLMMPVCVAVASSLSIVAQTTPANSKRPPAQLFHDVLPDLKAKSRVPILLPSELPAALNEREIRFVEGRGRLSKYEVGLYYDKFSGDAGYAGYFVGVLRRESYTSGKAVALVNGITGQFKAKSCGGSCSPSEIGWVLNDASYMVQFRLGDITVAEEEKRMIAVANSAIQGGPR